MRSSCLTGVLSGTQNEVVDKIEVIDYIKIEVEDYKYLIIVVIVPQGAYLGTYLKATDYNPPCLK